MQSSRCQHDTSTHAKFCLECGTPVAGGSGGHSVMFDLSSALKGAVRDEWTAGGTPILVDPLAVASSGQFAVYTSITFTPKAGGERPTREELGLYTLKNHMITREQFFYEGPFIQQVTGDAQIG